jgi:hypothetical protein
MIPAGAVPWAPAEKEKLKASTRAINNTKPRFIGFLLLDAGHVIF